METHKILPSELLRNVIYYAESLWVLISTHTHLRRIHASRPLSMYPPYYHTDYCERNCPPLGIPKLQAIHRLNA